MVLDSQRWKCVEAAPAILFSIEGLSAVRGREPGRRSWITLAEGRVEDVSDHHLALDDDVTLAFVLPPEIDLTPLRGQDVKLSLSDEPDGGAPRAQMLSIADDAGALRLFARFGPAGKVHSIGRSRVRTALSQRRDGPMAIGTEQLQYVLHVGEHVRMREPSGEFVVHFLARTPYDYVAYVIAEKALWKRR
jgi:hypothetical protein